MSYLSTPFLSDLRSRYGLRVFVETGCYVGDGIQTALDAGFEQVYSCDLIQGHVAHCRTRFSGLGVNIVQGDSLTALAEFPLANIGPTLFWLDAHYPAFYGFADLENERTRFPLPQELALIHSARSGGQRDVILADDMRVINAPDNTRWRAGEVDEYYRIDGLTMAEVTKDFAASHEWFVDGQQEGILTIAPHTA